MLPELFHNFFLSVGHIMVSFKSVKPSALPAYSKMNGDQVEETAQAPDLKLPDSEDEHKDEEMESNDEVAKVLFSVIDLKKLN